MGGSRLPSAVAFRWFVLATALTTYALIVLGGVVRTTGSGDACPDWPRCKGEIIPPLETGVLIEFSHRLLASGVGFMVLAVAIIAWRTQRRTPVVLWGAAVALVALIAQVILGGVTVLNELPPTLVTAHLALATTLLAMLLVIASASDAPAPVEDAARRERARRFRNLALLGALATFGLLLTGSYVTGTGAALAFGDWPLFDGRLLPGTGRLSTIHALHRFAALAVGLLLLYIALLAGRWVPWHRPVVLGMWVVVAVYVAQALVGAANIWTLLQPAAGSAHLALAVAVWAALVSVTLLAHRAAQTAAERIEPAVARQPRVSDEPAPAPAGPSS